MAEPTEPPSPPEGDATPDAGNPGQATPPVVAPKPGRQSARKATGADAPAKRPRRAATSKPAATSGTTAAPASPTAAPRKPIKPRPAAPRRVAARARVSGLSVATVPTVQPVDIQATDRATRSGGRWWKAVAGGVGAIAAGAALLSLRGSSRRRAHQADGTDSSKSFDAGIADPGTIPDETDKD